MEQFTAQFSWMISPSVMLAPYGLLTGVCYRSATDHVTRKWTEEWCQYYPVECGGNNSPQTATGAGKEKRSPGGGLADLEAASETEDLVQVIVSNVLMRYPTCYVMICDADIAVNSAQSTGDFQSTSSFQRFRSLHRRPTLTPCPASLPWVNWLTIFRTITVNRIMCVCVLFISFDLLFV